MTKKIRREILEILVKLERGRIIISDAVNRLSLIIGRPINNREREVLETLAIRQLTIQEVFNHLDQSHRPEDTDETT